jgi:uncharacterized protein YbaP (TraB family)
MGPFNFIMKVTLIQKLVLLCLLITIDTACTFAQSSVDNGKGNTLLWEISGNGIKNPSYLFGTFHLLCKEDIRFSQQLIHALNSADCLYLELDMDDPSVMFGMLNMMNMKNGVTLNSLYTTGEYARLDRFFNDSLKMSLKAFSRFKPSLIEALLYPKFMLCKEVSGVEDELMKLAKKNGTEIKGLETVAFQASVFDSIPYDMQARQLLLSIDSFTSQKDNFIKLMNIYKSQHINELEQALNEDQSFDVNNEILINGRNRKWVSLLKNEMLHDNFFIAVGAGHLVGEQGLISLMRKEGFIVKPVQN